MLVENALLLLLNALLNSILLGGHVQLLLLCKPVSQPHDLSLVLDLFLRPRLSLIGAVTLWGAQL